jgi:DNA-binding ferritin-like protein
MSTIDFKPPVSVAAEAAKGLEYRQKASPSNKGGLTPSDASKEGVGSGVQRAVNLKNRDTLSPKTISQMVAFFARHEKNKGVAPEHKNEPWNDRGHVAWLLWGGDAGKAWATKVKAQMDKKATKQAAAYPGNIGVMEMFKFYRVAKPDQKALMEKLLSSGKTRDAWELLKTVTGVALHDIPGLKAGSRKKRASEGSVELLSTLLAYMRALQWVHHTNHWEVAGDYGDHLLLQRLYEAMDDEIDTLAEKIVGLYTTMAVDAVDQSRLNHQFIQGLAQWNRPLNQSLVAEKTFQRILVTVRERLEANGSLTLGLDDFLAATASAHETAVYLLKQRTTVGRG